MIRGQCSDLGCWTGALAKGCELCIEGKKSVIFVTGLCPERCYYCPLSNARKNVDVMYVNEVRVNNVDDMILELVISGSEGAGITGGDPLVKLDRTLKIIRESKQFFGGGFHIHLYTTGLLLTEETMRKLVNAGLDEIRIHVTGSHSWNALKIAKKYSLNVGIENPVIPGKENELLQIIEKAHELDLDFVNLNELEISEGNYYALNLKGMKPKEESVGIQGSEKTALKVIQEALKNGLQIPIHYCPAIFKDRYQFRRRMIIRGKNTKRIFENLGDGIVTWAKLVDCEETVIERLITMGLAYFHESEVLTQVKLAEALRCTSEIIEAYPTTPRMILNSYVLPRNTMKDPL